MDRMECLFDPSEDEPSSGWTCGRSRSCRAPRLQLRQLLPEARHQGGVGLDGRLQRWSTIGDEGSGFMWVLAVRKVEECNDHCMKIGLRFRVMESFPHFVEVIRVSHKRQNPV